jgi:hypothetical protein
VQFASSAEVPLGADAMKQLSSWGLLLTTVAALSALQFGYAAGGTDPPESVARLTSIAFVFAVALWIVADARIRRQTPCYDFGFLVAIYFPISLFWYVFWSRGLRGILVLAALLGLMLLPWLSAVVAWFFLHQLA